MTHFTRNEILTPVQHGFRAGHSCESQLLMTTEDLVQNYEDKIQTDLIVLDFSMVFDVVPQQRLLHKLDHYRIRGSTLLWIHNSLTTRSQKIVVVFQTLLLCFLFICYINDLPSSVSSDVRLSVLTTASFTGPLELIG